MSCRSISRVSALWLALFAWFPSCDSADESAAGSFPVPKIGYAPESYVAYRSLAPLEIDGCLDDPSWQAAEWTSEFVDIEGTLRPLPQFLTRAKMLWDDEYLYVGAVMEEPHVWATLRNRDAIIYQDNDFEVFLDPDGDTHHYYELEVNAFGTEWDLFLVKPYRDGGPAIHAWDIPGLETAVYVNGSLNDPTDRDSGWSVEIAVPWKPLAEASAVAAPPTPGDQWRVNFSRVQWRTEIVDGRYVKLTDNPPGRSRPEDNWVWSPQGLINMHYPEMWGIVQFSGAEVDGVEEAFQAKQRDEAKWVLRRVYYGQRAWRNVQGEYARSLALLDLQDLPFAVDLYATPNLFEASIELGGEDQRIRQDGKVW